MSVPAKRELQHSCQIVFEQRHCGFDECPCEEGTATHDGAYSTGRRARVSMSVPAKRELQLLVGEQARKARAVSMSVPAKRELQPEAVIPP